MTWFAGFVRAIVNKPRAFARQRSPRSEEAPKPDLAVGFEKTTSTISRASSESKVTDPASSSKISASEISLKLSKRAPKKSRTSSRLEIPGYSNMVRVAEGANGVVYLGRRKVSGEIVAMKKGKVTSREGSESLKREYELIKKFDHPYVVKAVELTWVDAVPIMVMEFIPGKSLHEVSVEVGRSLNAEAGIGVAACLCSAVNYIAAKGIVHRDITPRNVVVQCCRDGIKSVVLVDFGAACQPHDNVMLSKAGVACYISPEMNAGLVYGQPVDVWGIGATVAASTSGLGFDELFDYSKIAVVNEETVQLSGSGWIINLRDVLPSIAADFVEAACTVSPNQRPAIAELLEHPYVRERVQASFELPEQMIRNL